MCIEIKFKYVDIFMYEKYASKKITLNNANKYVLHLQMNNFRIVNVSNLGFL